MKLDAARIFDSPDEAMATSDGPGTPAIPTPDGEANATKHTPASAPAASPDATSVTHSPAHASFPLVSTASVPTGRAARYGKQLVSHMAHKITGEWDESSNSGHLLFDREGPPIGRFDVRAMPSTLVLELRTNPERAEHLEHVTGIHLARFGARDGLTISWRRADGSEGTTQGPLTPADIEAHARARAQREAAARGSRG